MIQYLRPAYQALLARIVADLSALPEVLRVVLAAMWARVASGMHGLLDWVDAQGSPLTCELERLYDWAGLYGVDRLMATPATGQALATGVAGTHLLAGTQLRGLNGLDYTVLAAVVMGSGNTAVEVRCNTAGLAGNLVAGQVLALVDPVPGVNGNLTVGALGLGGGADDETVDDWRARVVEEWRTITTVGARGGKPDDYRFWAKGAHPSVTGAIVRPHLLGTGTVVVRPVCNGLADRMPTQAVLDAVSAYYLAVAPATADWRVGLPLVHPITITIHLAPAVDTPNNRAAIVAALEALVLSKGGVANDTLQLLWGEVDAAVATVTTQYTIDESVPINWAADDVPVLQPINWI